MKISVNAPSYKRAGGVDTLQYYPDCQIWVCETEEDQYRKKNPGAKIIPVPSGVQGNLCRIRNWILDREYERGIDAVCLIDDDLRGIGYYEGNTRKKVKTGDFFLWIQKYTSLADEWGVKLWGINCVQDKQAYREYTPFSTLSYIGGPFSVHVRSDIRYDERLPLKEDYDMTLQHLNKYRQVLRLNKFHYYVKQAGSGTGQIGGCATYRTRQNEQKQLNLLQKKWGTRIVKVDVQDRNHKTKKVKSDDINPIISVPIRGI
jgi:hypothetical protein